MQTKLVTNQELEAARNNEDYIKIAKSIFKKFQSFKLTADDKKQILLDALWYSLATWDEAKSKFTSHLYRNIRFKTLNFIKKYKVSPEKNNVNLSRLHASPTVFGDDFDNIISCLHDSVKIPIIQKFVYGMSSTEIGEENGYSKEYANQLIKKGIKSLKKSV